MIEFGDAICTMGPLCVGTKVRQKYNCMFQPLVNYGLGYT
jgi:hypothetical protein